MIAVKLGDDAGTGGTQCRKQDLLDDADMVYDACHQKMVTDGPNSQHCGLDGSLSSINKFESVINNFMHDNSAFDEYYLKAICRVKRANLLLKWSISHGFFENSNLRFGSTFNLFESTILVHPNIQRI